MSYPLTNTTADRVKWRKAQVLYKRKGKRYVPATDPWAREGLRDGHWYVHVKGSCTSIREAIYPNHMEVQAALKDLEDHLMEMLRKATEAKPRSIKLSPAEKRAWDNLIKVGGDSFRMVHYQSLQGIADELLGHIKKRLVERGVVPSAKGKR